MVSISFRIVQWNQDSPATIYSSHNESEKPPAFSLAVTLAGYCRAGSQLLWFEVFFALVAVYNIFDTPRFTYLFLKKITIFRYETTYSTRPSVYNLVSSKELLKNCSLYLQVGNIDSFLQSQRPANRLYYLVPCTMYRSSSLHVLKHDGPYLWLLFNLPNGWLYRRTGFCTVC